MCAPPTCLPPVHCDSNLYLSSFCGPVTPTPRGSLRPASLVTVRLKAGGDPGD